MRIIMLSWEYPPRNVGGLARHVYHLAGALAKHGVDVHVITVGGEGALANEEMEGVRVHRVDPYNLQAPDFKTWILHLNFSLLEYAVSLMDSLKKVDLIHAHDWLVAYAGRALKHAFKLPMVVTIHATEYGRNNGLHNETQRYISDVEWWLTYEAWRVIVCSSYMERELTGFFQLPADKLSVIPNGVRVEDFVVRSRPAAMGHEKYVFFIGRLVREKGVQVLIDAAPKVLSRFPEARFVVAGTGPYEEQLRVRAVENGVANRFFFAGYVNDDVRNRWYAQSSAAVFPSLYEPFGIVALEGMAAKAPVVVSDSGGLSEIVHHGIDGLKCYTGSANSLADNIMAILGDPVLAETLRAKGYEKAKNQYNWMAVAGKTLAVYEEVIHQFRTADWQNDPRTASNQISAFYHKIKNFGKMPVFDQRAH